MIAAVALLVSVMTHVSAFADEDGGGVIVWLEDQVPDRKVTSEAERRSGATEHFDRYDLLFPPTPVGALDHSSWRRVLQALEAGVVDQYTLGATIPMHERIGGIDLIKNETQRDNLVDALFLLRRLHPRRHGDEPWLAALALDPDRDVSWEDVGGYANLREFAALREAHLALPPGFFDPDGIPPDAQLVIDGRKIDGAAPVPLRPGRHYVHLERRGQVHAREVIDVQPDTVVSLRQRGTEEHILQAKQRVLMRNGDVPFEISLFIRKIHEVTKKPVHLAATNPRGRARIVTIFRDGGERSRSGKPPPPTALPYAGHVALYGSAGPAFRQKRAALNSTFFPDTSLPWLHRSGLKAPDLRSWFWDKGQPGLSLCFGRSGLSHLVEATLVGQGDGPRPALARLSYLQRSNTRDSSKNDQGEPSLDPRSTRARSPTHGEMHESLSSTDDPQRDRGGCGLPPRRTERCPTAAEQQLDAGTVHLG